MTDFSPDVQELLDESYESDLTEEESEEPLAMCGHGIGPKLSPAAKAVLDAIEDDCIHPDDKHRIAAAAIRAAADQVVPEFWHEEGDIYAETKHDVRADFYAIATELESAND